MKRVRLLLIIGFLAISIAPLHAQTNSELGWATYFGSLVAGVATDKSGNVYITGGIGIGPGIATVGAYQTFFGGGDDAFLAKFNSKGNLIWATYFGGDSDDYGYNVITDDSGNIYIAGTTFSDTGIATTGAYQVSKTGRQDAFIAKFSPSGSRLWATYYGGNKGITFDDTRVSLAVGDSGNIYLSGSTAAIWLSL